MRKILAATTVALALTITLAGCITINIPAQPGNGTAPSGETIQCDGDQTITDSGTYTIAGRCGHVVIEGNDIVVTGGEIVNLDIDGDRVRVNATATTTLVVHGNSNVVDIETLSDAQVTGDRNDIHSTGALDRAVVNGNDNKVLAEGGIESVFDNGERSEIG